MSGRSAAAVGAAVVLGWWWAAREGPSDGDPGPARVEAGAVVAALDAGAGRGSVAACPFQESQALGPTFAAVDRLTRHAPAGARVALQGSDGAGLLLDDRGIAEAPAPFAANPGVMELPARLGGGRIAFPADAWSSTPDGARLVVDVFARLEVVVRDHRRDATDPLTARATAIAELPRDGASAERIRGWADLRAADVAAYRSALVAAGAAVADVDVRAGVASGKAVLDVPFTGDVEIAVEGRAAATRLRAKVERGRESVVYVDVDDAPFVAGAVRDASGLPLGDAEIRLACRTEVPPGEAAPVVSGPFASQASVDITDRKTGARSFVVAAKVRTAADGSFRIAVPFTDRVAAYAFLPGREFAKDERRTGARRVSVEGLALVAAARAGDPRTLLLVDDVGAPLPGCKISLGIAHPHDPFVIQFPTFESDAFGRVDVTHAPGDVPCNLMIDDPSDRPLATLMNVRMTPGSSLRVPRPK